MTICRRGRPIATDCGGRDASLDRGQRHAEDAEHATECHYQREDDRQQPERGRSEEDTPHADCDHCDDVVGAKHGMGEAGEKPPALSPVWAKAGVVIRRSTVATSAVASPPPCGEGLGVGGMGIACRLKLRPPSLTLPLKGGRERTEFAARPNLRRLLLLRDSHEPP